MIGRTKLAWPVIGLFLLLAALAGWSCSDGGGTANPVVDGDASTDGDQIVDGDQIADGDVVTGKILRMVPNGTLDFGDVQLNTKPTAKVEIFNDGNEVLRLFDANWLNPVDNPFDNAVFDNSYMEAAIQPGQSFSFDIQCAPIELGQVEFTLQINNDSDNNAQVLLKVSANIVQPMGDAEIGSDPQAIEFSDQSVGTRPGRMTLRIGNSGAPGSTVYITSVALEDTSEESPFWLETDEEPFDDQNPAEVQGGQSMAFVVWFDPSAAATYTDTVVVDYYTHSDSSPQIMEIPVEGTAVVGAIAMQPSVLDFGLVTQGQSQTIDVELINMNPDATVTIENVQISELNPALGNYMNFFTFENQPGNTALSPASKHEFSITFSPTKEGDFSCLLKIKTDYEGSTFYFPIKAEGTGRNQKPIARVAQRASGPDILTPIVTGVDTTVQLYGDISYDPDDPTPETYDLEFDWYLQKPGGSAASLVPGTNSPIVNLLVDKAGSYAVTLIVTDELGLDSDPKIIQISAESGTSTISIEATYKGISGESDVDLSWVVSQLGTVCDEDHINQTGGCLLPEGYGAVRMEACGTAADCTVERITHANAPDGRYEFRVKFDEDCPGGLLGDCYLGIENESATVTIQIYVDQVPTFRLDNIRLDEEGDQKRWQILRTSGTWMQPTPLD